MALLSPLGGDRLAHQLEFHGDAHPAGVDQPDDPAVTEMHAAPHVVEAELDVVGRDPDVAREGQLDASADDPPVERGDDRLRGAVQPTGDATGEAALQEPAAETRTALQPAVDVRGQVGAGAERLVA